MPYGALMSPYILKTLARHLAATHGNLLPGEKDDGYHQVLPGGALSLAATAVSLFIDQQRKLIVETERHV